MISKALVIVNDRCTGYLRQTNRDECTALMLLHREFGKASTLVSCIVLAQYGWREYSKTNALI